MSIATEVKAQHLTVRKSREDQVAISLLTVLVSDIERIAKEKGHDTTDEEAVMVIRRLLKSNAEMHSILTDRGRPTTDTEHERKILESFLPKQLSEHDLRNGIQAIFVDLNPGPKDMGKVMGEIKKRYGTSVNMKIASEIVKQVL
jgi:hypothetical protein